MAVAQLALQAAFSRSLLGPTICCSLVGAESVDCRNQQVRQQRHRKQQADRSVALHQSQVVWPPVESGMQTAATPARGGYKRRWPSGGSA